MTDQTCDACGEPFDDTRPAPYRFDRGPFAGKVVHEGDCEVNIALAHNRGEFEKRPQWQQRPIQRAAGPPPWGPPSEGKQGRSTINVPRVLLLLAVVAIIVLVGRYFGEGGGSGGGGGGGVARVETSGCWSGAFGDRTVEGCGPQDVPLESTAGVFVANAQKQGEGSEPLTLILLVDGREVDRATTLAAYGIVQVDSG